MRSPANVKSRVTFGASVRALNVNRDRGGGRDTSDGLDRNGGANPSERECRDKRRLRTPGGEGSGQRDILSFLTRK
jgi:hypothetical protein